ncbi:MAG: HAD family hydrolase [Thermoprotei archaeon]
MFKAIIFDMDGTLVDSKEAIQAQLSDYALSLGLNPLPKDALTALIGKTDEEIATKILGQSDEKTITQAINWFNDTHDKYYGKLAKIFPKVPHCLELLTKHGYRLGLVSNATSIMLSKFMSWSGLGHYFDVSVAADQAKGKPAPDMLLMAARRLAIDPREMIYVGDTAYDIIAAKSAGAVAVAVLSGVGGMQELAQEKPDLLLPEAAWVCRILHRYEFSPKGPDTPLTV